MTKLQARNETIINAPADTVWAIITDINLLHKINPGVTKASGRMARQGDTRICEIINRGKKGTMTERLIEVVPGVKTVWTIENDTMGMSKMIKDTRFVFLVEKIDVSKTKVTNETYYRPANLLARIMNTLMMRRMISNAQEKILANLSTLTQKK
jgi:hypothetical protein